MNFYGIKWASVSLVNMQKKKKKKKTTCEGVSSPFSEMLHGSTGVSGVLAIS